MRGAALVRGPHRSRQAATGQRSCCTCRRLPEENAAVALSWRALARTTKLAASDKKRVLTLSDGRGSDRRPLAARSPRNGRVDRRALPAMLAAVDRFFGPSQTRSQAHSDRQKGRVRRRYVG